MLEQVFPTPSKRLLGDNPNMSEGYIYVKNWDRFQHYKDRRPTWIKNYLDLLENDDYLDLGAADRALLECIWKWTGLVGNGRVPARVATLRRRFRLKFCQLDRLIEAGFIEVRDSKALANGYQPASPEEEGSKEPKEERRARANGGSSRTAIAAHKKEVTTAILTATTWLEADTRPMVEHSIRDLYPAFADEVIAGLPKEPA